MQGSSLVLANQACAPAVRLRSGSSHESALCDSAIEDFDLSKAWPACINCADVLGQCCSIFQLWQFSGTLNLAYYAVMPVQGCVQVLACATAVSCLDHKLIIIAASSRVSHCRLG